MAAPMDVSGSEEEEKKDEEIDVFSPNFNPLKALYAPKVTLPIEDASIFNNLAEYERFMSKSKEEPDQAAREHKSAPISRRALERRHLEHMREKTKELPKSTRHLKKMYQLNVLSRMESQHTMESPLDLLRQCVEKRCKVRVCIRSFKGLRSICIGYLVAFDKIWNMALTDVVEIYKRPSTGKRFHHEEKVTYSMIMSNLNPPPKKPDPPKPLKQEQEKNGETKKRAKECKFCRIKHEALMEQRRAAVDSKDAGDSKDADSSQSWTDTESSWSETDEDSSTEESTGDDGKVQRKPKTPKKSAELCPNGHVTPRFKSRISSGSSRGVDVEGAKKNLAKGSDSAGLTSKTISSTRIASETSGSSLKESLSSKVRAEERVGASSEEGTSKTESVSLLKASSVSKRGEAERVSSADVASSKKAAASSQVSKTSSAQPTASSSSSSVSSRKSDLLLSRMTTPALKQEPGSSVVTNVPTVSAQIGHSTGSSSKSQTSAPKTSTTPASSSLSKTFSKSLTIGKTSTKSTDSVKNQGEKVTKSPKEVVHLDPKTGKRLIQPEEFKRRHVNQLFIRGDQVVMVSVDSAMVEVDVKKPIPMQDEKSVPWEKSPIKEFK